jgi:hypothetical protein
MAVARNVAHRMRPAHRVAHLPRADPPKVMPVLVGQEYVGTTVLALQTSLEATSRERKWGEISVPGDKDEQVDVLRAVTVGEQRTDQRDPLDAWQSGGRLDEADSRIEETRPSVDRRLDVPHRIGHACSDEPPIHITLRIRRGGRRFAAVKAQAQAARRLDPEVRRFAAAGQPDAFAESRAPAL